MVPCLPFAIRLMALEWRPVARAISASLTSIAPAGDVIHRPGVLDAQRLLHDSILLPGMLRYKT